MRAAEFGSQSVCGRLWFTLSSAGLWMKLSQGCDGQSHLSSWLGTQRQHRPFSPSLLCERHREGTFSLEAEELLDDQGRKALSDDPASPDGFLSWQSFFLRHCPTTALRAFPVPANIAPPERELCGAAQVDLPGKGLNICLLSVVSVSLKSPCCSLQLCLQ